MAHCRWTCRPLHEPDAIRPGRPRRFAARVRSEQRALLMEDKRGARAGRVVAAPAAEHPYHVELFDGGVVAVPLDDARLVGGSIRLDRGSAERVVAEHGEEVVDVDHPLAAHAGR